MEYDMLDSRQQIKNLKNALSRCQISNMTALRIFKKGNGCLYCPHCRTLSEKLAYLEQFRYISKDKLTKIPDL